MNWRPTSASYVFGSAVSPHQFVKRRAAGKFAGENSSGAHPQLMRTQDSTSVHVESEKVKMRVTVRRCSMRCDCRNHGEGRVFVVNRIRWPKGAFLT
ncbi:hypothetical protein BURK_008756 [Burkholderia sp. SJ98]|nr:hypothetical protein BURK_008756 [Burkholderia sp. SJ98]